VRPERCLDRPQTRSHLAWFVGGVLLGPIGIIVAAIAPFSADPASTGTRPRSRLVTGVIWGLVGMIAVFVVAVIVGLLIDLAQR
jgi:uncharacterized membrane protein YidH (DUF202 family)